MVDSLTSAGLKARDFDISPERGAEFTRIEFRLHSDLNQPRLSREWISEPASFGLEPEIHIALHRHGLLLTSHVHRHRSLGVDFAGSRCRQEVRQIERALAAAVADHL